MKEQKGKKKLDIQFEELDRGILEQKFFKLGPCGPCVCGDCDCGDCVCDCGGDCECVCDCPCVV